LSESIKELLKLAKVLGKYSVIIGRVALYIHLGKVHYITADIDANILTTERLEETIRKLVRELRKLGYKIPKYEVEEILRRLEIGSVASLEIGGIKIDIAIKPNEEYEVIKLEEAKVMVKPLYPLLRERLNLLSEIFEETYALDIVVLLEEIYRRNREQGIQALKEVLQHPNLPQLKELVDACIMKWRSLSLRIPEDQRTRLYEKLIKFKQLLEKYT